MNTQRAQLRYLKMAPRKVRLMANLIKGLPVNQAEAQLMLSPQRAGKPLLKLLRSAVANVKNNKHLSEEKFFIESLRVDGASMLKRFLPRARGMATPLQKKLSHVTMILAENPNQKPSRFKIVVQKKTKLPSGTTGAGRREKPKKEEKVDSKPKDSGFFRKMFRGTKKVR